MRYNKAGKEIVAITDSRVCKGDVLERIELLAQSGVKAHYPAREAAGS